MEWLYHREKKVGPYDCKYASPFNNTDYVHIICQNHCCPDALNSDQACCHDRTQNMVIIIFLSSVFGVILLLTFILIISYLITSRFMVPVTKFFFKIYINVCDFATDHLSPSIKKPKPKPKILPAEAASRAEAAKADELKEADRAADPEVRTIDETMESQETASSDLPPPYI